MGKKLLVSIITPCYNEEKYLEKYFHGLLSQTYDNIQVIFVNDGSKDNSENIYHEYKDLLHAKFDFTYLYQDNKGYISAINKGLDHVKGDLICFFDADDIMMPHKIESHVNFLDNNKDCYLVFSDGYIVNDSNIDVPVRSFHQKYDNIEKTFEDILNTEHLHEKLLTKESFSIASGTYCFRRECLEKIPKLKDEFDNRGQNHQILVTIAYYYKIGYNKVHPVMKYVVHNDSTGNSKSIRNYQFKVFKRKDLDNYLLDKFDCTSSTKSIIENKYLRKEFRYLFFTMEAERLRELYRKIKASNIRSKSLQLLYYIHWFPWLWRLVVSLKHPELAIELNLKSVNAYMKKNKVVIAILDRYIPSIM